MGKNKNNEVFSTALVEKRNILNEIRNNGMSLQELRFFSIYLSKINARDASTRTVMFPIADFQKIMGLHSLNFAQIRDNFTHLLQQVVSVPNENGKGFTSFQLFKRCMIFQNDETSEWIVKIDAHDDALPLMFEFKSHYFTYELWNALQLKSPNQIRMYEILKQYEKLKSRELTVVELRALLGISKDEYPRWNNFKVRVLDSCQQALKEYTDICYTYEKGRSGRGGAWLSIIFHIEKNTEYADPLALDEFIDLQVTKEIDKSSVSERIEHPSSDAVIVDDEQLTFDEIEVAEAEEYANEEEMIAKYGSEYFAMLAEYTEYAFTPVQISRIASILSIKDDILPDSNTNDTFWANALYLKRAYDKFRVIEEKKEHNGEPIKNRFAYFEPMLISYKE